MKVRTEIRLWDIPVFTHVLSTWEVKTLDLDNDYYTAGSPVNGGAVSFYIQVVITLEI